MNSQSHKTGYKNTASVPCMRAELPLKASCLHTCKLPVYLLVMVMYAWWWGERKKAFVSPVLTYCRLIRAGHLQFWQNSRKHFSAS